LNFITSSILALTSASAPSKADERPSPAAAAFLIAPVEPARTVLADHALAVRDGRIESLLPREPRWRATRTPSGSSCPAGC
jgi:hypothetical protein